MKYLADTEELIRDGILTQPQATEIARRSREAMISLAINTVLFAGILAVIGGMAAYLEDEAQLTALGAVVTLAGGLALMFVPADYRLLANATSVIGAAMLVGGGGYWAAQAGAAPMTAAALGLPVALAGYALVRRGPKRLRFLAGWLCFLGGLVHLAGLLAAPEPIAPQWLLYHYAGAVLVICGLALDIRAITALAIPVFAAGLAVRSFPDSGFEALTIREPTLTILQMTVIALACLWLIRRSGPRLPRAPRHAEVLGRLAFIWVNMAFWVGSMWGDKIGSKVWGPVWSDYSDLHTWNADKPTVETFRALRKAFLDQAWTVSEDSFAILWALVILAVGVWAALGARRMVFNTVLVFGAVHIFTQYFQRIDTTPGAVAVAGLIAIGMAFGSWRLNAWLRSRVPDSAE